MDERETQITHRIGPRLGLWYPLLSRLLAAAYRVWPSVWIIPADNHLATDLYVGACWLIELAAAILFQSLLGWHHPAVWLLVGFCVYRFLDIAFVVVSIMFKGFYRQRRTTSSAYRLLLMSIFNAFEIMFLFAVLYMALATNLPEIAGTDPPLRSVFHALYFSITTGTTLGYGTPAPTGWFSEMLVMVETLTILLGVAVLIGRIAGAVDTESAAGTSRTESVVTERRT